MVPLVLEAVLLGHAGSKDRLDRLLNARLEVRVAFAQGFTLIGEPVDRQKPGTNHRLTVRNALLIVSGCVVPRCARRYLRLSRQWFESLICDLGLVEDRRRPLEQRPEVAADLGMRGAPNCLILDSCFGHDWIFGRTVSQLSLRESRLRERGSARSRKLRARES